MTKQISFSLRVVMFVSLALLALASCGGAEPKGAAQKLGELLGQGKYEEAVTNYLQIGTSLDKSKLPDEIARMGAMFDLIKSEYGDLKSVTVNEISKGDQEAVEQIVWRYQDTDAAVLLDGKKTDKGWRFTPNKALAIGKLEGQEIQDPQAPPDANVIGVWNCNDGTNAWDFTLKPDGTVSVQADLSYDQDADGEIHSGTFKQGYRTDLNRGGLDVSDLTNPRGEIIKGPFQYVIYGAAIVDYYGVKDSLVLGPAPVKMELVGIKGAYVFECTHAPLGSTASSQASQNQPRPTRRPTEAPMQNFRLRVYGMNGQTEVNSYGRKTPIQVTITGNSLKEPLTLDDYLYGELPAGDYQVQVQAAPYQPATQTFTLKNKPGGTQEFEITLAMAPLNPEGLYIVGDQIIDAKTGKEVVNLENAGAEEIIGMQSNHTAFIARDMGYGGGSYKAVYLDGTPAKQFVDNVGNPLRVQLNWAPNLKQVIFFDKSDLWLADVDWNAFQLKNTRRVTRVGVFDYTSKEDIVWHPDGKHVVVQKDNGVWVNLDSGEVKDANIGWYNLFERRLSPDGTTVVGASNKNAYVYDVATNTKTELTQIKGGRDFCWLSNERVAILMGNGQLWNVSRDGSQARQVVDTNDNDIRSCSEHFVTTDHNRVIDMDSGAIVTTLPKDVRKLDWLDAETLWFTRDDNFTTKVEERGTWRMNARTNEMTRISPYLYEAIGKTQDGAQILFTANETLWRVNPDGTQLEELGDAPKYLKYPPVSLTVLDF